MSPSKPTPKAGDPCPSCGGEFVAVPTPTDEQRSAAANKENPAALPAGTDTASVEQIAELGALFKCANCGYKTRIKGDADAGDESAGNGEDDGHGGRRRRKPAA